jgi:colanic acid/amylovoran biosynthesis glycosyltransferase
MTDALLNAVGRPQVAVLRLQLFKPSETFIPAQVNRYVRYQPIYLGRTRFGPNPEGATVCIAPSDPINTLALTLLRHSGPLMHALQVHRPKVLHAHFAVDAVYGLPLARRLGIPMVTTLHGFDVTTSDAALLKSGRPALINAVVFRRKLQRHGDLFICVSDFIRKAALDQGYPPERTVVLPIGIDSARFEPFQPAEPGLIVHVARLVEKKGTVYLLRALAALAVECTHARLAIIGDGPLRSSLENEAQQLGIADRVQFLGVQVHAETKQWIARAEVVAVPSVTASSGDSEGLPTICFEAAAYGVPVVASRTSGIPEAVLDGETGILTAEADVPALQLALKHVLTNPHARKSMSRASRALVETRFDMIRQTQQLEAYYDQLIGRFG